MSDGSCPRCGAAQAAHLGDGLWETCPGCGGMVFRPGDGPRIVVAYEAEEISQQIGEALVAHGFSPVHTAQGGDVLTLSERTGAEGAVLDVGLVNPTAFEIIDRARAASSRLKILLVASVYDRTRYKRRPTSLYGADDYVEQHHIVDHLPVRMARLVGYRAPPTEPGEQPTLIKTRPEDVTARLAGADRVRVAAKRIVADIALYHQSEMEAVRSTGSTVGLEDALDEGRDMLAKVADLAAYPGPDPIGDALTDLLDAMRYGRK